MLNSDESYEIQFEKCKQDLYRNKKDTVFDVSKNIKRLLKLKDGDLGFFYLSIISFIEGYLRQLYNINFGSRKGFEYKITRNGQEIILKKDNESIGTILESLMKQNRVDKKQNYKYPNTKNISYEDKINNSRIIKLLAGSRNPIKDTCFVGANSIRHCFTTQTKSAVCQAIDAFIDFSKIYDFYDTCKVDIDNLKTDTKIHESMIKRELPPDTKELQNENIKLSKIRDLLLKIHPNFESFLDSNIDEEDEEFDKLDSNLKEFLYYQNNLKRNQETLGDYAKSWRNYQTMLHKLTDEQEKIEKQFIDNINNNKTENFAIQAGPGSGKTVLLIDILHKLIDKDIVLLTYTDSLTKYNRFIANQLNFSNDKLSKENEDILISKIDTLDTFINRIIPNFFPNKCYHVNYNNDFTDSHSKKILDYINELLKKSEITDLTASYIFNEALTEIWSMKPEEDTYIDGSYRNRKPITNSTELTRRSNIWNLVNKLENYLDRDINQTWPYEYAYFKLTYQHIPDNLKVDYLLIDEAQDLDAARFSIITKLTRKSYVLAGDLAQSVFIPRAISWNLVAEKHNKHELQISKHSLTKNFRSTEPIQNLAKAFFNDVKFVIKNNDIVTTGFMPGPIPEYAILQSKKDAIKAIKNRIKILKDGLLFSYKEFCIVASNDRELQQIKDILGNELPCTKMEDSNFDFNTSDTIRLSTVKYVKGIDCPIVLFLLSGDYENQKLNGDLDTNGQFNGIYACITRAMNMLSVFIADTDNVTTRPNKKSCIQSFLKVLEEKAIKIQNPLDGN